jgi:hypothetical protein
MGVYCVGLAVVLGLMDRDPNWVALTPVIVCGLGLVLWGLLVRRTIRRLLVHARTHSGRIISVVPMSARINSRTFFRIRVRLVTPEGGSVVVQDSVDNWAVESCLQARDQEQDVEVLYQPNVLRRALLPLKFAASAKFH